MHVSNPRKTSREDEKEHLLSLLPENLFGTKQPVGEREKKGYTRIEPKSKHVFLDMKVRYGSSHNFQLV